MLGPNSHEVDSGPVLRKASMPRSASRIKPKEMSKSINTSSLPPKPSISDFNRVNGSAGDAHGTDSSPRKLNPIRQSNGFSSPNRYDSLFL